MTFRLPPPNAPQEQREKPPITVNTAHPISVDRTPIAARRVVGTSRMGEFAVHRLGSALRPASTKAVEGIPAPTACFRVLAMSQVHVPLANAFLTAIASMLTTLSNPLRREAARWAKVR